MKVDVAVIGGGAAGLAAALSLPSGLRTAVFCKRALPDCASALAQGGIAAALAKDDNAEAHAADTLRAGDGLCNSEAVREITGEAAAAVEWLDKLGVRFNRAENGFALGHEGGHSARRIAHADDATGRAVTEALAAEIKQRKNIRVMENSIAVNLHTDGGACRGVYVLELRRQTITAVNARAVILAAGGAGKVYLYATTPPDATGDGVALAYRAGCAIANMEFVQFHPTCLYHPLAPPFLVSEALRGEGARLAGADGGFFLENSGASELSPRDAVARAIDVEMKRSGADCVYLDLSAHPASFWRRRFPTIMRRCEELGFAGRIPVVPAAHYCCGGAQTDLAGRTDLPGLFAAGETACNGMHGANRLASNSLLECVAAGRRAAKAAAEELQPAAKPMPPWDSRRISAAAEDIMVAHNWEELRRIMWNYVGIARSGERLIRARRRIEWIEEEIEEYYQRHAVSRDFLELRNLVRCALLIVEGALSRQESRGLHFRLDYPNKIAAADTVLRREDFLRRARAANRKCPFSGRQIVANALLDYNGKIAGFCNPHCRDKFAAAAACGFAGADKEILTARDKLDAAGN